MNISVHHLFLSPYATQMYCFSLLPSFSRCDLVVVANGWKEKIASGLTICVVIRIPVFLCTNPMYMLVHICQFLFSAYLSDTRRTRDAACAAAAGHPTAGRRHPKKRRRRDMDSPSLTLTP
jgi:hypothetical protein